MKTSLSQRFLTLFLAFGMIATLLPAIALAGNTADAPSSLEQLRQLVEAAKSAGETTVTLTEDMDFTDSDTLPDMYNVVDISGLTLDLGGHTITAENNSKFLVFLGDKAKITNGTFAVTGGNYALFVGDDETSHNFVVENVTATGINVYNAEDVTLRNVTSTAKQYYAVWCDANAHVTIESGSYGTADNSTALLGMSKNTTELYVQGGNFDAGERPMVLKNGDAFGVPVFNGGTFSQNISEYLAPGVKQSPTGQVIPGDPEEHPKYGDAAQVGGEYFPTLQAAIDAAGDRSVTLLADLTADAVITVSAPLTINGCGHTVSSTVSQQLQINADNAAVDLNDIVFAGSAVQCGIQINAPQKNVTLNIHNCVITGAQYALNLYNTENCTVTITDSTLTGGTALNLCGSGNRLELRGGNTNIDTDSGLFAIDNAQSNTLLISGGSYPEDVSAYTADGYECVLTDGRYIVRQIVRPPVYIPIAGIEIGGKEDDKPEQPEVPVSFPDVKDSAWYHDAVVFVLGRELMNGFDDGTFRPESGMTRGMIAAILYRLDKAEETGLSSFQDINHDAYYANAVAWGVSNGIISGYNAHVFAPDDPVTREQFAVLLYRYAKYKGYDVSARTGLSAYTDAGDLSAYAADSMNWAVAARLVTGMTDTTLGGGLPATRAQVACMLTRFCELVVT